MLSATVLIPAFQPTSPMLTLVEQISPHVHSIIIVNDGSSSAYTKLFTTVKSNKKVHYLEHTQNQGKGAALKSGMLYWQQHLYAETQGIITADADGQHTVADILKLAQALCNHPNTLHLGTRNFTKSIPLRSYIGNIITRSFFHLLTGYKILDTQTGLRSFPEKFINKIIELDGTGYEYETKVLVYALKHQWSITQHTIETIYIDDNSSSHFRPLIDSCRVYGCLIKTLFA